MEEVQCAAAVPPGGGGSTGGGGERDWGGCLCSSDCADVTLDAPAAGDFRHGQGRRSLLRREHDWEHRLGLLVEGLGTCQ